MKKDVLEIPSLEPAVPHRRQQQQQLQQPQKHYQNVKEQEPHLPVNQNSKFFAIPDQSNKDWDRSFTKVPDPATPKHRNESVSDRKPSWTSGSESTAGDFSPFKPVSSVQQLLSLYSQHKAQLNEGKSNSNVNIFFHLLSF